MAVTQYVVDADKQFQKAIKDALKQVNDLTIPFKLITKSWFKGNEFLFKAPYNPSRYTDLTENYKKQKKKAVGFIYPILRRSGLLEESITDPSSGNSINLIINGKTLVLGTKVPYAAKHQFGEKVPARPFLLIGGEQTAPDEINRRKDAWIATIRDYVMQKSQQVGTPK
jgi:phage gpG-like protein